MTPITCTELSVELSGDQRKNLFSGKNAEAREKKSPRCRKKQAVRSLRIANDNKSDSCHSYLRRFAPVFENTNGPHSIHTESVRILGIVVSGSGSDRSGAEQSWLCFRNDIISIHCDYRKNPTASKCPPASSSLSSSLSSLLRSSKLCDFPLVESRPMCVFVSCT